ncbi:hypothetical protein A176_006258 [Myxococcus hansupus]|uniref:Uncharacterized protein n=1 Tax=Pseudomyxococcus hansupus TaxID=1297742 RepID=A0A0H4X0V8_9BACT|nr:hypothetical protein A176_006258 [Myxococcus hansupus]
METLKSAVQALYRVHAVEGPPGENGLRTVWHLCPDGAELMSLVDLDGRVRRQELTLLEDHYVWASGEGVRTGHLERAAGARAAAAAVVQTDPELVPQRLLRAALAMGTYTGQDRYLLHMQRVLALAREGLEMKGGSQRPSEPTLPAVEAPPVTAQALFDVPPTQQPGTVVVENVEPPVVRPGEGMTMVWVLALGLLVGLGMLAFILAG